MRTKHEASANRLTYDYTVPMMTLQSPFISTIYRTSTVYRTSSIQCTVRSFVTSHGNSKKRFPNTSRDSDRMHIEREKGGPKIEKDRACFFISPHKEN